MAPQSLQSPSCCKPAARWRHNCCHPLPTANLPLDGIAITAILFHTCPLAFVGISCRDVRRKFFVVGMSDQNLSRNTNKVSTQSAHRQMRNTLKKRHLVFNMGATWWQAMICTPSHFQAEFLVLFLAG